MNPGLYLASVIESHQPPLSCIRAASLHTETEREDSTASYMTWPATVAEHHRVYLCHRCH